MELFEIYLKDLKDEAKAKFLKFIESDENEVDETCPIMIFEKKPE